MKKKRDIFKIKRFFSQITKELFLEGAKINQQEEVTLFFS